METSINIRTLRGLMEEHSAGDEYGVRPSVFDSALRRISR